MSFEEINEMSITAYGKPYGEITQEQKRDILKKMIDDNIDRL